MYTFKLSLGKNFCQTLIPPHIMESNLPQKDEVAKNKKKKKYS